MTQLNTGTEITLTAATVEDAETIFDLYMEDKEELKEVFSFVTDDLTKENEEDFFANPRENHPFVIRYNNQICGFALLYDHKKSNNSISVLYYINSKYRGHGIATIAVIRLLEHAFENLNINRAEFFINTDNYDSIKLVDSLGIRCEGTLLDNDFTNGKYHDQKLYSILRREYKQILKNIESKKMKLRI